MTLHEETQQALANAIEAGAERDNQLAKSERSRRWMLIAMVVLVAVVVVTCVICVVAVVGYGHGAVARSSKFETVLVCSANSEQAVAKDIKIANEKGNAFVVPATCVVPK